MFAAGDQSVLSQIWSAAVSASTDLQLTVTPAFGGQRPNEEWLVEQLQKQANRSSDNHAVLLTPVMRATQELLQESAAVGIARPAGWLLLSGICHVLAKGAGAMSYRHDDMLQHIVDVITKYPQLDQPPDFVAAVTAAAAAGAAAGDLKYYHLAVQQAEALKLTADGVQAIRSAAIGQVAAKAANGGDLRQTFLRLWSDVVDAVSAVTAADQTVTENLQPPAAAAVVSLLAKDADMTDTVLTAQMPLLLLTSLL